jgi:hypothetical protein
MAFHENGTGAKDHRIKAQKNLDDLIVLYKGVDQKVIGRAYKIYAQYYYLYLQFICIDLDGKQSCMDEAVKTISEIEILQVDFEVNPLKTKQLQWLSGFGLSSKLKILKAQVYALKLNSDVNSTETQNLAIEALKEIGGEKSLKDKGADTDRILKYVYSLAFPDKKVDEKNEEIKQKIKP